jgi:thiol-disulfide isomerase/thioredoxin
MTWVVALLTVVVVLLVVLVAGLLRSHAAILRRLDELGVGLDETGEREAEAQRDGAPATGQRLPLAGQQKPGDNSSNGSTGQGRAASDIVGTTLDSEAAAVRVTEVDHDTVLAFLSSGCVTCEAFWQALHEGVALPEGARLVVVAADADQESPATLASLAPDDLSMVLSTQAWRDYAVPGSPYIVYVNGAQGRVRGEGTGQSWDQVTRLLAQGSGDLAFVGGGTRAQKANADAAREQDTDAALLAAGIEPGDPRLYPHTDPADDPDAGAKPAKDQSADGQLAEDQPDGRVW